MKPEKITDGLANILSRFAGTKVAALIGFVYVELHILSATVELGADMPQTYVPLAKIVAAAVAVGFAVFFIAQAIKDVEFKLKASDAEPEPEPEPEPTPKKTTKRKTAKKKTSRRG